MSERFNRAKNGDIDAMFEIAVEFQKRRFHEEAKSWYLKAIEKGHLDAAFRMGDLLYHQGEVENSIPYLQRAYDGGHEEAQFVLALALRDNGEFENAEKMLKQLIEQGVGQAVHELGVLYIAKGEFEKGVYWIELSADSGNVHSMDLLPNLYLEKNDVKNAIRFLKRFIEKDHATSAISYGLLLDDNGDTTAIDFLEKGLQLGYPKAELVLGNFHFIHENYELSEEFFRRALSKSRSLEGTLGLGVLLCEMDAPEEGLVLLKEAAEYGSIEALYNIGVIYYTLGKKIEAEEWLQKAISAGDEEAKNFYSENYDK